MNLIYRLSLALILTVVIEAAVAAWLGYRTRRDQKCIFLVNVITNPAFNYLLIIFNLATGLWPSELFIIFLEMIIVVIEWRLLARATGHESRNIFALSLLMNAASYSSSLLIEAKCAFIWNLL